MKAIDLYAAHALGALISLRPSAPHEDDRQQIADDAFGIAHQLALVVCVDRGHDWPENDYKCERCGTGGTREAEGPDTRG